MGEEYKRNLGISISSTNVPTIQMCEDKLKLSFLNWDNENIEIEFASTLAFRWHHLPCPDRLDDDVAFEVLNSQWVIELLFSEEPESKSVGKYHHYQFCVYGCWLFEVVAEGLGLTKDESEFVQVSRVECTI